MQHFCSIFRLNKCIWESWLSVVFVVCPLGGNVPKHLFHQKRVLLDTFQCSIHLRFYYKNFTIYNIFCIIIKNWTFWFDENWFDWINIDSNELEKGKLSSFCKPPAWWKRTQRPLLTKLGAFESSKAWKAWKSKLCSFCKLPAWWKSTHLSILTKLRGVESFGAWQSLKKQTLFIFWAPRLVEIYSFT